MAPVIKGHTLVVHTRGQWEAACHGLFCSTEKSVEPWGPRCSDQLNAHLVSRLYMWTLAAPPRPWSGSPRTHLWWAPLAWPSCGRHRQSGSPGPTAWTDPSGRPLQSSQLHEGLCPPSSPIPPSCLHRYREKERQTGREEREREREIDFHCCSRYRRFARPCFGSKIKNPTVINLPQWRAVEGQIKRVGSVWGGEGLHSGITQPLAIEKASWWTLTASTSVHMMKLKSSVCWLKDTTGGWGLKRTVSFWDLNFPPILNTEPAESNPGSLQRHKHAC